jgi:CheY-like chemotaxis protein
MSPSYRSYVSIETYYILPYRTSRVYTRFVSGLFHQYAMITCEELERELHEALAHLYDPDYQPSEAFCSAIGCDVRDGVLGVQTAILRAIESLRPPSDIPPTAHARQVYELLHNRFVLKLIQEETADRMHISRTSVHRAQRTAVHTLARTLWECSQSGQSSQSPGQVSPGQVSPGQVSPGQVSPGQVSPRQAARARGQEMVAQPAGEDMPDAQAADWQSQVQRELASLQARAPDTDSDVGKVIGSALELVTPLTSRRGVRVDVKSLQPGLVATVHPVVLGQILVSAMGRLARYISNGLISVYARLEDGNVKITLTGTVAVEGGLSQADLVSEIPASPGVAINTYLDGSQAFVWIEASSVGKVTVLVVDDNEDMAHLYRGATVGTRYHIAHIAQGRDLFGALETVEPDVIVLDVMLPDIDGWRLLMRLHEDPATRAIPVIVCSVVREEDLALSLGAVRYLPKPVRPREFIQALDQVFPRAAAGASISPASNAEAD